MKVLSLLAALAGVAVLALGVIGRFRGEPSIWVLEHEFSGQTFLLLANSLLLAAVYLRLMDAPGKRGR